MEIEKGLNEGQRMPAAAPSNPARTRFEQIAAALLPWEDDDVHRQVARVLSRVVSAEQREHVRSSADVVAAFRSKGLIPPRLLALCAAAPSAGRAPEARALAFAACVYPQRAYQMAFEQLALRLAAYEGRDGSRSQPATAFLEDIGALDSVSPQDGTAETEARRAGAALYAATWHAEGLQRMQENWKTEAAALRFLRGCLPSPPSTFLRARGQYGWGQVAAALEQAFPERAAERKDALILEQMAAKAARDWLQGDAVSEGVREFWESIWDRLVSGFPYYAFASRLTWWWGQCLENYRFGADPLVALEERHDQRAPAEEPAPVTELSADDLRVFREGYRLVRSTFFRRADKAARAELPRDPVSANERVRTALDALFYERLLQRFDEDTPPELVQSIAARYPDLGADTINNLSHRLRLRTWAFSLGRLLRLRDEQIRSARPPRRLGGAGDQPLLEEPGALPVAALARVVPAGRSLLWAFTAHVFIYPRLLPQRPDPWSFERYLRELWHWVVDESFEEALRAGAEAGSRVDRMAQDALHGPLGVLVRELREQPDAAVLGRYLSLQARRHEAAALEFARGVASAQGLCACADGALRHLRAARKPHLIVPAWYLRFAEGCQRDEFPARLRMKRDEASEAFRLWDLLDAAARAACPAGVPPREPQR
jgi:hypothetical protein